MLPVDVGGAISSTEAGRRRGLPSFPHVAPSAISTTAWEASFILPRGKNTVLSTLLLEALPFLECMTLSRTENHRFNVQAARPRASQQLHYWFTFSLSWTTFFPLGKYPFLCTRPWAVAEGFGDRGCWNPMYWGGSSSFSVHIWAPLSASLSVSVSVILRVSLYESQSICLSLSLFLSFLGSLSATLSLSLHLSVWLWMWVSCFECLCLPIWSLSRSRGTWAQRSGDPSHVSV